MLSWARNHAEFIGVLVISCAINTFIFIYHPPVFYLPDLALILYLVYKLPDLNQEISLFFFAGLALLCGYYFLSPQAPEINLVNNYILVLKPFFYICVLALYSRNVPQISVIKWARIFLMLYPLVLLWNLFLVHLKESANLHQLMGTRPYFIFENNFEITFYLNCFCIAFFIYKERKLFDFAVLVGVVGISGSRSGLLSFAAICLFYFCAVNWWQKISAIILAILAFIYIGKGRNISAPIGTIDRVQSLQALLSHYDFDLIEVLKVPFGFGIYQKVPGYICTKLPDFAEWFTGNSHNCDPLMLQGFYSRALYQYGIYVTLLVPLLFLLIVKKETGWRLAIIILTPITFVATSVGGFSNGLAFWGILLSVYAFLQCKKPNLIYHRQ